MSYVLLTDTGEVDVRQEPITPERLVELTGEGMPEVVRTKAGDRMAFWVNDSWISQVQSGEVQINKVASVFNITSGGGPRPMGGPVVVTGLRTDDGQLLPADLDDEILTAVTVVTTDVAAVMAGDGKSATFHCDPELTGAEAKDLEGQIEKALQRVTTMPLVPLAGGYDLAAAAQAALDSLRDQGYPEFLVEMIAESVGVPYAAPNASRKGV